MAQEITKASATIHYNDTTVYDGSTWSWTDTAYQSINITKDTHVSPAFYSWFMANAKRTLNSYTWDEINEIALAGNGPNYFSIGDTKEVTLNGSVGYGSSQATFSNTKYWVYIIGFDHNSAKEGTGIAFQGFKTAQSGGVDIAVVADYKNMGTGGMLMNNRNTNQYGWAGSDAYKIIMPQWKAVFPSDLQSVIKSTTLYTDNTGNGSASAASAVTANSNEVYYLAEYEVFGTIRHANTNEQTYQQQYDYYKAGNSKVKVEHNLMSEAVTWWLRSLDTNDDFYFCGVSNNGNIFSTYPPTSLGSSPCFKVGSRGGVIDLTPQSGITYTTGLSNVSPTMISYISKCISNNADVTNETTTVYYDDRDNNHYKISVADQVTMSLNGTDYAFDIIGFNHDELTDSAAYGSSTATGKAGITWQMHDCFVTSYPMNSSNTNTGGWKSSVMRTSTMPLMKSYMPVDWQSSIKAVNKKSGSGGDSSSGTETTSDDCYLLAEVEIFGSITYSVSDEGTQYAYYVAGNSKVKNKSGSVSIWWERSFRSGGGGSFCRINGLGAAAVTRASASMGVAFAFCT